VQIFDEKFNLKNLNDGEVKKLYRVK